MDDLLADDLIEGVTVGQIIPLMEFVELFVRPWLKKSIPEKYKGVMTPEVIMGVKDLLVKIS